MIRRSFLRLTGLLPMISVAHTKFASHPIPTDASTNSNGILLMTVPIAGIQLGKFSSRGRFAQLYVDQELMLVREPDNKHDERAISIHTCDGRKVGYVPMTSNAVPSNLMDQGHTLSCTITSLEYAEDPWDRAMVRIGMASSFFKQPSYIQRHK